MQVHVQRLTNYAVYENIIHITCYSLTTVLNFFVATLQCLLNYKVTDTITDVQQQE